MYQEEKEEQRRKKKNWNKTEGMKRKVQPSDKCEMIERKKRRIKFEAEEDQVSRTSRPTGLEGKEFGSNLVLDLDAERDQREQARVDPNQADQGQEEAGKEEKADWSFVKIKRNKGRDSQHY